MRKTYAAVLAAVLLTLTGCSDSGKLSLPVPPTKVDVDTPELRALKKQAGVADCEPGAATGSALPAITLPCLGGGPDVTLSGMTGPMIINLWQSFCGPCIKEMPALQAFNTDYGDRVPVLGIDYLDVQPAAALRLAQRTGVTYPLIADTTGELNAQSPFPRVIGVPYVLLVDESGDIVEAHLGGVKSEAELVSLVREHLGIDL